MTLGLSWGTILYPFCGDLAIDVDIKTSSCLEVDGAACYTSIFWRVTVKINSTISYGNTSLGK